jgi:hypothetical protein
LWLYTGASAAFTSSVNAALASLHLHLPPSLHHYIARMPKKKTSKLEGDREAEGRTPPFPWTPSMEKFYLEFIITAIDAGRRR